VSIVLPTNLALNVLSKATGAIELPVKVVPPVISLPVAATASRELIYQVVPPPPEGGLTGVLG
jgi:hypothetical protein